MNPDRPPRATTVRAESVEALAPALPVLSTSSGRSGTEALGEGTDLGPASTGFADAPGGVDNPLLDHLGITLIDVGEGHASFGIDIERRHLNRQGSLQGGVAATLLDAACGYAGLGGAEGQALGNAVTVMLSISYLRKASAGRLRATGRVVKSGRSMYFSSGELLTESGDLIATAQGAFKRSTVP